MTSSFFLLVGYVGPDAILPFASLLAAVGGVFLMFWNTIRRAAMWCARKVNPSVRTEQRGT